MSRDILVSVDVDLGVVGRQVTFGVAVPSSDSLHGPGSHLIVRLPIKLIARRSMFRAVDRSQSQLSCLRRSRGGALTYLQEREFLD
ncbi:MAG: hypothetical protein KAV82_00530 [Phycisphaerae bacterium]|nr:hypothetical protein [Phycisphaerae bacterium]